MIVGHISMKDSYDLVFLSLRLGLSLGRLAVLTTCIWRASHEEYFFALDNVTNE